MGDLWCAKSIGLQWSTSIKRLHHGVGNAGNYLISTLNPKPLKNCQEG
jgi:hypothetical protein